MNLKKENKIKFTCNIILLLLSLVVSNIAVLTVFSINEYQIIASSFTYPFVFYFANRILKVVNKKTFFDIIIGIIFVSLILLYIMNKEIYSINFSSIVTFFIAQMINMFLVCKMYIMKKDNLKNSLMVYIFIIIIDAIIFNILTLSIFNLGLLYSVIFKLFVGLILCILENKKIK